MDSEANAGDSVDRSAARRSTTMSSASDSAPLQSMLDIMTLAHEMQAGMVRQGLVKDRKWRLKTYKMCFLHQDGLRWLVDKVLLMEQGMSVSASGGVASLNGGGGGAGDAASVCSSFTSMEHYLDELKVKATRMGNLMIKAGYLSHVCDDHQFNVNHKSKTLFFKFHLETSSSSTSSRKSNGRASLFKTASILNPKRNPETGSIETDNQSQTIPEDFAVTPEMINKALALLPSPVDEVHASSNMASDEVSVMTSLTHMSNASTAVGSKATVSASVATDSDRVVDVGLFSIVIDLYRDLRYLKKIKDRNLNNQTYKYCFLHEDCMEWLCRKVQTQYQAASQGEEASAAPLLGEDLLPTEQLEEIAARIGNLIIEHGYASDVLSGRNQSHSLFRPNTSDSDDVVLFKFREKVIAMDYKKSNIGQFDDAHIDNLQQTLFERETRSILN